MVPFSKASIFLVCAAFIGLSCSHPTSNLSVKEIMDKTFTNIYHTMGADELSALNEQKVLSLFTPDEHEILSTRHWSFDVNTPAVVSIFRSIEQKTVPFWLPEQGFTKTTLTAKNENTTYEVWQKNFPPGHIGLGVNGFENYTLHYFVSVAPQSKSDKLILSNLFPENQTIDSLRVGVPIYHDWEELVLTEIPADLKGEQLLTTIRGRGVESHLIGAFRKTTHPSSAKPDQVMLTWSSDPSTGIDVQWRTDTTIETGTVKYRIKGTKEEFTASATSYRLEDRVLMNDRYINRFTASLRNLKPGNTYEYQVAPLSGWSEEFTFSTPALDNQFSFTWFGDTHFSPKFGDIFVKAAKTYPDAAFYSIAGDQVSDGLFRNQWDDLFDYSKDIITHKPFMSVLGNHDARYGLGASMYQQLFSYPKEGPVGVEPERSYAFEYKNALFLMIDCISPIETQSAWIEKQLAQSKATWKFAMFHFPPYNWEEPYLDIQKAWVPIFDKYHVDLVMGGHIHYYMRSKPMKAGKVVLSYNNGTAYIISIGIESHAREMSPEPYAAVRNNEGPLYQNIRINGNKLSYVSVNAENKVVDTFEIKK